MLGRVLAPTRGLLGCLEASLGSLGGEKRRGHANMHKKAPGHTTEIFEWINI